MTEATEVAVTEKPKKTRAPRKDYGYSKDAVIKLTEKSAKYRGKRKNFYEIVAEHAGKTVKEYEAGVDGARGYLRFFVEDGTVELTKAA